MDTVSSPSTTISWFGKSYMFSSSTRGTQKKEANLYNRLFNRHPSYGTMYGAYRKHSGGNQLFRRQEISALRLLELQRHVATRCLPVEAQFLFQSHAANGLKLDNLSDRSYRLPTFDMGDRYKKKSLCHHPHIKLWCTYYESLSCIITKHDI